jgi:hypothetical protein
MGLLKRDFPRALESFTTAYQAPKWQIREQAAVGLGDMLDSRIIEQGKQPMIILSANWEPPRILSQKNHLLSDDRLLVLMENYRQTSLWHPQSIQELKTLKALHEAYLLLQRILLNDAHYMVRLSTLLVLTEIVGAEHVLSTLHRAYRQENDPLLKAAIAEFL